LKIILNKLFTYDLVADPSFSNAKLSYKYDREAERKKLKDDRIEKLNKLNNFQINQ